MTISAAVLKAKADVTRPCIEQRMDEIIALLKQRR